MSRNIPFIPYFETSRYKVQTMIELAAIRKGERAADLGTGDGRIAIALAKAGAIVTGYELDTNYFKEAQENIRSANLTDVVTIKKEDFWDADLSDYPIITIYPMPDIMSELEKKLQRELKKGSRVLTNYYTFPNWKYTEKRDNIFLYHVQ